MPNHCECDLWVTGVESERDRFVLGLMNNGVEGKGKISILNTYFPCPEELHNVDANMSVRPELVRKYGASDWYEWCNAHWGTKWGDYDTEVTQQKSNVFITFRSAWAPPIEGLLEVSKKFPKLTFRLKFYECGMEFKGIRRIKDGKILAKLDEKYTGHRGG